MYKRAHIYFSLTFLVAFVGFFPSYFSKLGDTDAVHHFHGIMASAWMIMLITQAWLMRERKIQLHRKIGRLSLLLAPLFVLSGLLVVHVMLASTNAFSRTFGARLAFLDITTIMYFALAYGLAIWYRTNIQLHARFMASTAVLVLPPALARLLATLVPGINSFEAALHGSYVISELIVILLLLDDHRMGRARPPYLILLGILLMQHGSFLAIPHIQWWRDFTTWIGAL